MHIIKTILYRSFSLVLAILVFNFSICLFEMDAMQRLKPNNDLVSFLVSTAGMQGAEEDSAPTIEIDLFIHHKPDRPISTPYHELPGFLIHEEFALICHPREIVTPPPKA